MDIKPQRSLNAGKVSMKLCLLLSAGACRCSNAVYHLQPLGSSETSSGKVSAANRRSKSSFKGKTPTFTKIRSKFYI